MSLGIEAGHSIEVEGVNVGILYGVRGEGENQEHIVTVPGVVEMISAPTKDEAFELARAAILEVVNERRAISARETRGEVDANPAAIVYDEHEPPSKEQELISVSLSELARTLASLDRDAEPHKAAKASAESALTKITTAKKKVIAEIEKRGVKILDGALGLGEWDVK